MIILFGYVSAVCIISSFVPYFVTLFKGATKPERTSWFLWALLGGISFFSQLSKGATHSLWLPGIQALGDFLVFILAIKYGIGGWKKRDKVSLVIAMLSLVVWYVTGQSAVALFAAIIIDANGVVLTMIKSYELPSTEPISSWTLTGLSGFFAIFAVGQIDWILLAFPVYTFVANVGIVLSIIFGKRNSNLRSI